MRFSVKGGLIFSYTLFSIFSFVLCQQNGDPWTSIASSEVYIKQPECSQECLLNVQGVSDCVAYGCVCTGDSRGTNFVAGFTNISACAEQTCGNDADASSAVNAFRDICLLQQGIISTTSTATPTPTSTVVGNVTVTASVSAAVVTSTPQPTTPTYLLLINTTSYLSLNPCSKFTLNSCRDPSGIVNEPDCHTENKPSGWDQYRGLANQLQCTTPSCLCAGGAFNLTYGTLWRKSLDFCNYLPSTQDHDDPEYDRLQGVLADYCEENRFSLEGTSWVMTIIGNSTVDKPGLSTSDKIGIGVGVPAAVFTLVALSMQSFQTWLAWCTRRSYSNSLN